MEATALAARTDNLVNRAQTLADLAEVYRLAGRPKEAAEALAEAIRLLEAKGNAAGAEALRGIMGKTTTAVGSPVSFSR